MPDLFNEPVIGLLPFLGVFYLVFPSFPLFYVIIRWRAGSEAEPGLGTRAGLHYFRAVSTLVVITAVALLVHSIISKDAGERSLENLRRVAAGLLVGGGLFLGLCSALLSSRWRTGEADERIFTGLIMVVAGLVTLTALLVVTVTLFQKNADFDDVREPLAWLVVWAGAFLVHAAILGQGFARADRNG